MNSINVRFPLLPVTSLASGQQRRGRTRDVPVEKPAGSARSGQVLSVAQTSSRSSSTSSSRKRSKSPVPKSHASFFGSMSTSWFTGKWTVIVVKKIDSHWWEFREKNCDQDKNNFKCKLGLYHCAMVWYFKHLCGLLK